MRFLLIRLINANSEPFDLTCSVRTGLLLLFIIKHTVGLLIVAIRTRFTITSQNRPDIYIRLFPSMHIAVTGLNPSGYYMLFIDMIQIGNTQWKYQSLQWVPNGKEPTELQSVKRNVVYGHPDGTKLGSHWMSKPIIFSRLKLTNDVNCPDEQALQLQSMHRYIPRVNVVEIGPVTRQVYSHTFNETEFIAVTAYQNTDITQLKIDHNPFAKGFRDEANGIISFSRE